MNRGTAKTCITEGCGTVFVGTAYLCRKCRDKQYRRKKVYEGRTRVNRAVDHTKKNVVNVGEAKGTVKIDGLLYKIGVMGRAFYYADKMWKLSSRPAKSVAEQIEKIEKRAAE